MIVCFLETALLAVNAHGMGKAKRQTTALDNITLRNISRYTGKCIAP